MTPEPTIDPKRRLPRNIIFNWMGLVLTAAVAFYLNPFLVHHLGTAQFGIWALCFSILAYTDFFDVGVRQSLARYIPKYYGVHDYENLNRVLNTGNFIYGIVGVLTLLTASVIAFFFLGMFNVPENLFGAMRLTLIIVGINGALIFFTMAASALGPFHRYDLLQVVGMTFKVIETAAIIYFLSQGYQLIALALIVLAATAARMLVRRIMQQRLVPQIKFALKYVSREMARKMIHYGTYSFLIVLASIVIFNTDNIVIGIFVSTSAVTYYAIALTVMQYLRNIVQTAGVPLVTAISHMEATSNLDEVAKLSEKMMKYLFYLCTCFCCGVLVFSTEFVNLWMGPGFELTVTVLWLLLIPAIIYLPQATSNSILFGIGKHRLLFFVLSAEALANIVLSLILVHFYGVKGVALGTAIPQVIIYSAIYPVLYHRVLKADVRRFYRIGVEMIALAAAVTVPVGLLMKSQISIDGWAPFCLAAGITTVVFAMVFVLFILESEDRARVRNLIFRRSG